MKKNRFIEKFQSKTDSELLEIIDNKTKYNNEAVEASRKILSDRNNILVDKKITKEIKQKVNYNVEKEEIKFIPEKEEYHFKYSFLYKIIVLFGVIFLLYFGFLGLKKENGNSFLLIIIAIISIIYNFKLIKNKSEIIISKNGVWTNKLELKYWTEIETIIVENKGFTKYLSKYKNDNLFIYLKGDSKTSPSDTIDLRGISNKKTLRKITNYYIHNKDSIKFLENTFVHGNTIYDTENQLESYKKSYPKIILIVVMCSFAFPFIDKFWDNGFILIEKYGYLKSVTISFIGFSSIYLISYFRIYYKSKKR